jgi:16S rRNA (guanine966-N2)-methyltransferase
MNRSRERTQPTSRSTSAERRGGRNFVRIIGGRWRSLRIQFPATAQLRPTPDRVRETLFNWLQPAVAGASCLDLFAGSGALGIEALSRGATHAVLVDRDPEVVRHLRTTLDRLEAGDVVVVRADALEFLRGAGGNQFDLIFLDPPFAEQMLSEVVRLLAERGWVRPGALIYFERPAAEPLLSLPAGWSVIRTKKAGQVGYYLARAGDPAVAKT